ncbi:MAG: hypothetical protein HQM15_08110 [Deltaproteobacteria bacterium]|nr:hypothetical protein [Deltaproteobacteria bacterium]
MKKIKTFLTVIALFSLTLILCHTLISGPAIILDSNPQVIQDLKKSMYRFGSLVAGLEILRVKEKQPDWETIDVSIKEIENIIHEMQKLDKDEVYKQYTANVSSQVTELKKLSKKKDKKIYEGFDKLSNDCFQCHAAHRPADFLKSKDDPGPQERNKIKERRNGFRNSPLSLNTSPERVQRGQLFYDHKSGVLLPIGPG